MYFCNQNKYMYVDVSLRACLFTSGGPYRAHGAVYHKSD